MLVEKKGVTLIALIITIIVMLILAGVVVTGNNIAQKAEEQRVLTNMFLIQTKVKIIMEKASFSEDESLYDGTKQTSGEYKDLYEYNQEVLNRLKLNGIQINNDEHYYIDYRDGNIIYKKGETEYKLSDFI